MVKTVAILTVLVMSSVGLAGSVTYNAIAPIPQQATDISTSMSFPQWDPTLFPGQTLTSVDFWLEGTVLGTITLTNTNPGSAITASASTQSTMQLADLLNNVVVVTMPTYSTGMQNLGPGASQLFGPLSNTLANTGSTSSNLAQYIGNGTVAMSFSTNTLFIGQGGGGNLLIGQSTEGSAVGEVTYNFTPEPTTLALLALGGLLIRRRQTA